VRLIQGGVQRRAIVHVPAGLRATTPTPLVLSLHGTASDPADQAWVSGLSERADRDGFVVAYPAGTGDLATWNFRGASDGPDDARFLTALIARLGVDLCLDPQRTFATGFSAGAAMAKVLACVPDAPLAGVALVSPVLGPSFGDCRQPWPVPTIVFAGILDPLLPYRGGLTPLPLFADWPPLLGVEDWASGWAAANGCDAAPVPAEPIGFATLLGWQDCTAPMVLWTLGDGGHAWPGGNGFEAFGKINHDISATDEALSFFGVAGS
jgi:polyhydroxybutyrate depolymerase